MQERRKTRRFPVRRPAVLIVHSNPPQRVSGTTDNVSALGALVLIDSRIAEGTTVELVLNLEKRDIPLHYLSCPGKVVRTDSTAIRNRVAIAIACEHTFTEASTRKPVV